MPIGLPMGILALKMYLNDTLPLKNKYSSMFKLVVLGVLGGMSFIFSSVIEDPTDPDKEKVIQSAVMGILNQYHYQPEDINDEFSQEAYTYFLEYVDSRKRFYTKEDLAKLESYKLLIDDQINASSFEFFDKATDLLQSRVDFVEGLYGEILEQPFDFTKDESFEFDPDKKDWARDEEDLINRWRRQLKYDVMVELTSLITKQEGAKAEATEKNNTEEEHNDDGVDNSEENLELLDDKSNAELVEDDNEEDLDFLNKSRNELEADARAEVLKDYKKWYKSFQKVRRSDRFESYLNTFAHMFDPHSDYFNPKEKQDFDINMGGKLEGIGARLQTDGDLTKVSSIVPGGPVWKDKQIEVNDHILKVRQKDGEPLDIFGMRLDDVVSKIRGKKGTYVTLTIKKKDGSTIDVELERDIINIEESFAKSAILDLDGTIDKVGYIDLPKFYSTFDGPDGNSCAADVAREIKKLKKNDVNGIVLDLRNNGGGSLKDVVDMSGLFIEDGPIVQVKPRARRPYVYKDDDKDVNYDGPLIVMINSFSASASEILAAAMQDYGRAIIVGSQSFGKGTVQRFIDLDKAVKGNHDFKPLGQIKLTMQKFYRVDGGSTQLKGVTPDVALPDRYRLIDVGEREYPNAMEWSQLSTLEYDQEVYELPNKQLLAESSTQRLSQDEEFALILEQGEWYKKNRDKTSYSLNLEEHQAYLKNKKEQSDRYKDVISKKIEALKITNLPEDSESINFDETTIARNESWVKRLNKDIYLEETMYIMRDLINSGGITAVDKAIED